MYISLKQVKRSVACLADVHPFFGTAFLAFKEAEIPVGDTAYVVFAAAVDGILDRHYKPAAHYPGYFVPFKSTKPRERWRAERYGSTSIQRITTDTFGDALLHPKNSSEWGWKDDYVQRLHRHLDSGSIPAFDLAVWLFRDEPWPEQVTPDVLVHYFFERYNITPEEQSILFSSSSVDHDTEWLSPAPFTDRQLLHALGRPPGLAPDEGAALLALQVRETGPASLFSYDPGERLNLITGDNSLGKTFLLDCIWWVLTGSWLDQPVLPRLSSGRNSPRMSFKLNTDQGESERYSARYNWDIQDWTVSPARSATAGMVIYARYDGSFAVWDPARAKFAEQQKLHGRAVTSGSVLFDKKEAWYGKRGSDSEWICNGLLRDWVSWQTGGARYADRWASFVSSLRQLSPGSEQLIPGEPTKLRLSDLEIPTLSLPYGPVPLVHASAGVQRAVTLAYILVWAWHRHLESSAILKRDPQRRMVLLVDEVEAHLHPRWQRVIIPSLLEVVTDLASEVTLQTHIATHSPMVLASSETVFDHAQDKLHHLRLNGRTVLLEEMAFVKLGPVDRWLMSDVFGLDQARSVPAEEAIQAAIEIQKRGEAVHSVEVQEINSRLILYLAQDDEFWPRWRFFARQHGVKL